jgi:hypothetical protein
MLSTSVGKEKYLFITHNECIEVSSKNEEYAITYLRCCQSLISLNMISLEERALRVLKFDEFKEKLTTSLTPLIKRVDTKLQVPMGNVLLLLMNKSLQHKDYADIQDYNLKAVMNIIHEGMNKKNQDEKSKRLEKSGHIIFKRLIEEYRKSAAFATDCNEEFNNLIQLTLKATVGSPQNVDSENLKTFNSESLCKSLMKYFKKFEGIPMENLERGIVLMKKLCRSSIRS